MFGFRSQEGRDLLGSSPPYLCMYECVYVYTHRVSFLGVSLKHARHDGKYMEDKKEAVWGIIYSLIKWAKAS